MAAKHSSATDPATLHELEMKAPNPLLCWPGVWLDRLSGCCWPLLLGPRSPNRSP